MAAGGTMAAIRGRLVGSAKLELVLVGMLLRAKPDGGNLVSMRRLEGSADVYSMVNLACSPGSRPAPWRRCSRSS
ncbi:hypothetical protein DL95DRAFT_397899, partial [Leptodontidium sp. 2 PMI_412]